MVPACFGGRLADSFLLMVFSPNTRTSTWVKGWMCNPLVILISLYYHWNHCQPILWTTILLLPGDAFRFSFKLCCKLKSCTHTKNNPDWVPFCMQRGMPVRHFPVYLKKERLSFSSTISLQALKFLECLEEAVPGRRVSSIRAGEAGASADLQRAQLSLPLLLTQSPGTFPSPTGLHRNLTCLLCPLQVLLSVWWWWHGKERCRSAQELLQISDC